MSSNSQPRLPASRQELFRQILGAASLPPQHSALVDLLLQLDGENAGDADEGAAVPSARETHVRSESTARSHRDERPGGSEQVAELESELRDLRELNDTVAAALGACRLCWGGDDACELCRGHGAAGWATPDPKLFRELVVPAVERVRVSLRRQRPTTAAAKRRSNDTDDLNHV